MSNKFINKRENNCIVTLDSDSDIEEVPQDNKDRMTVSQDRRIKREVNRKPADKSIIQLDDDDDDIEIIQDKYLPPGIVVLNNRNEIKDESDDEIQYLAPSLKKPADEGAAEQHQPCVQVLPSRRLDNFSVKFQS